MNKKRFFLYIFLVGLMLSMSFLGSSAMQIISTNLTVIPNVFGLVQWAIPESRVGSEGTNDDIAFYLTARNPVTHSIVYIQPDIVDSSIEGSYLTPISLSNVNPGSFDIGIKTTAHLTRILRNVQIQSGNNTFNFSQPDNSPLKGNVRLLAGDINGLATEPSNTGDDIINSADLSILLGYLDQDDLTGNSIRSNLNQDSVVNAVDLNIILDNLDKEGDR